MGEVPNRETFESMYAGKAPWDIGRPQPVFVEVADRVAGAALDAGCGTGENALFFAGRGHPVLGIDFLDYPIQEARRKAQELGLDDEFTRMDALTLGELDRQFDSVIDSRLFHVFSDEDRARYVTGLANVTRPGGRLFLLCLSDEEPGTQGNTESSRTFCRSMSIDHTFIEWEKTATRQRSKIEHKASSVLLDTPFDGLLYLVLIG